MLWALVAAGMVVAIAVWGTSFTRAIDHQGHLVVGSKVAPVVPVTTFVTQYPNEAQLTQKTLCAQYVPTYNSIVVSSTTGAVISNIQC